MQTQDSPHAGLKLTKGVCCAGGRDGVQQGVEAGQNEAFEDVQLGPLLGQGGFGKVYRGLWNGAAVAVKVRPAAHSTERGSLQSGPPKSCQISHA